MRTSSNIAVLLLATHLGLVGCTGTQRISREELGNDSTRTVWLKSFQGSEFKAEAGDYKLSERKDSLFIAKGEARDPSKSYYFKPFEGMIPLDSIQIIELMEVSSTNTIVGGMLVVLLVLGALVLWVDAKGM